MSSDDFFLGYASGAAERFWHGRKRDANHHEIASALRSHGATVLTLDATRSKGHPDVLIGFRGFNILAEIKMPGANLLPQQEEWHKEWKGKVYVIRTVEEAIALLKTYEELANARDR